MSVIELNKNDIKDLEDGYTVRLIVNGRKYDIVGANFLNVNKYFLSTIKLQRLKEGEMVKVNFEGKEIGLIGPQFEL